MPVPKFDINFLLLTDGDLIQKTISFADRVRGHPAFQDIQEHVPGYDRLMDLAGKLQRVSYAAQFKDTRAVAERDKIREEIITSFTFAGQHAVMVATHRNDPSLLDIGLEQKQRAYSKPNLKLPRQARKVTAKNIAPPGTIVIYVSKCPEMKSIEVQITDDPSNEDSWRNLEMSYNCRIIESGLDLVKRYYIRARFHNSVGYGPWSKVIDIVVS